MGVQLSRQTMSKWLTLACEKYLTPLYALLKKRVQAAEICHADETTLQVLHEPNRTPQQKSYMWLFRTGKHAKHPAIVYEYHETRRAEHPKAFFRDFKGYVHTDGYAGYHDLPEGITVVGCMHTSDANLMKRSRRSRQATGFLQSDEGEALLWCAFFAGEQMGTAHRGRTLRAAAEAVRTVADGVSRVAGRLASVTQECVRTCGCLHAGAMAMAVQLSAGWQAGDLQQSGRTQCEALCHGTQELPVRQYAQWSSRQCDSVQSGGNRQGVGASSVSLSCQRAQCGSAA